MRFNPLALGILFSLFGSMEWADAQQEPITTTITVEGTDQDLADVPLIVELPAQVSPGRYQLTRPDSGANLPGLVYRDQDKTYLGFILDQIPAKATTRFGLAIETTPADPLVGIRLVEQGQRIAVEENGHPWTTYVPDDGPKPYFDPLVGPGDVTLTRGWPMREIAGEPRDHPHHRSLWFAHMDVNKSDSWSQVTGHGSILEIARPTVQGGGPVGILRTRDDWLDKSGKKVCEDERLVQFYATKGARVFDFAVTLKATDGPVKIGDNKDGVFGIRLAAPLAVTAKLGGQITNSRGLKDKAAWGQAAEWVDYTGPLASGTMGVAILNEPSSFRFPTTWHVRDYGLFAANPFGWHDFGQANSGDYTIPPGESIRLSYRVILHEGTTDSARIAARFQVYAHPPRVTVQ